MMVIQFFLIVIVFGILAYFLSNQSSIEVRAYKKIGLLAVVCLMVISIIFPEALNTIAKQVGVGRGADLLLYLFIMVFVFFGLNMYIKFKQQQDKIYRLARKLALFEAELQKQKKQ